MPPRARELKRPAWRAMRAAVPPAVLITLVYWLLTSALDTAVSVFAPSASLENIEGSLSGQGMDGWMAVFLSILLTLYLVVMRFGYRAWALRTARGEQIGYGCLLDGFGIAGQVLMMELHILLRLILWGLLAVMALTGLLTSLILLIENPYTLSAIVILLLPLLYLLVFLIVLRYSLAPYLLWDYPDAGPGTAVRRGVEMMRGNLWRMLRLYLSFWPWFLLDFLLSLAVEVWALIPAVDTMRQLLASGNYQDLIVLAQQILDAPMVGILSLAAHLPLFLFFTPYFQLSTANFYRDLSRETVEPSFSGESF